MQSEGEGKGDTKKNGISAVCLHLLLPRVAVQPFDILLYW